MEKFLRPFAVAQEESKVVGFSVNNITTAFLRFELLDGVYFKAKWWPVWM